MMIHHTIFKHCKHEANRETGYCEGRLQIHLACHYIED